MHQIFIQPMRKLWHKISYLGIEDNKTRLEQRTTILNNQLNAIMLITMFCLLIFLTVMNLVEGTPYGIGTLRVLILLLVNVINLSLSYFNRSKFSRILLIFMSPVIFLILPTLIGFVEEESFTYYPFILIAFSILPQLLLIPSKEKFIHRISIVYYGFLLLFIERILIHFMPEDFPIVESIKGFFVYFKVAQIAIFAFLQFSVFYLRRLNIKFEQNLNEKNQMLDKQNEELKQALEKLQITQQQLIQLEKMSAIGTLTSGVAHEINNPLNFISGGLDLLNEIKMKEQLNKKRSRSQDDFDTAVHIIREGVIRASKVVNTLMNFSYKDNSVLKPMDIHQVIENTLLFCNSLIPEEISIQKNYQLCYEVPIYEDKMHQVFLSIIENAIASIRTEKSLNGHYISFHSDYSENGDVKKARISIENSGPKIPDDVINKIFDPFFTTKDPGEGTGLGLSIAYSFVKEHSGTIEVNNTENGVRFTIELPI